MTGREKAERAYMARWLEDHQRHTERSWLGRFAGGLCLLLLIGLLILVLDQLLIWAAADGVGLPW